MILANMQACDKWCAKQCAECEAACDAFSRSQHCHLSSLVNTTCQAPELVGRECVFDILQRICEVAQHLHLEGGGAERGGDQEHGTGRTDRNEQAQEEMDELCCLQLDHMRDEKTYIKTIRSWARDLGLHGRCVHVTRMNTQKYTSIRLMRELDGRAWCGDVHPFLFVGR